MLKKIMCIGLIGASVLCTGCGNDDTKHKAELESLQKIIDEQKEEIAALRSDSDIAGIINLKDAEISELSTKVRQYSTHVILLEGQIEELGEEPITLE